MTQASNVGILTPKINSSGQLDATTGLTGAVPVANGGTGAATYTANNVLLGNGTSAFQTVAPSTNGNVLTSNGTTWVSSAPAGGGGLGGQTVFTSNGTFTIPSGKTVVKVTVVGAGGGSAGKPNGGYAGSGHGGGAGASIKYLTSLTPGNTLTVTVGVGGTAGASGNNAGGTGGTSSVASGTQTITTVSATGGAGGGTQNAMGIALSGTAGAGSNGDINITGTIGRSTTYIDGGCSGNTFPGVTGGSSIFLATNSNPVYTLSGINISPVAGVNYGSGGVGSVDSIGVGPRAGAAGASGVIIFEY